MFGTSSVCDQASTRQGLVAAAPMAVTATDPWHRPWTEEEDFFSMERQGLLLVGPISCWYQNSKGFERVQGNEAKTGTLSTIRYLEFTTALNEQVPGYYVKFC